MVVCLLKGMVEVEGRGWLPSCRKDSLKKLKCLCTQQVGDGVKVLPHPTTYPRDWSMEFM